MRLRQLEIENFRSIRSLKWRPDPGFNLLLGSGDTGKTTILDAVDLVLGPRWSVSFTDADFTDGSTERPITITATIGDLPPKLLGDPRFELLLRGWHEGELHDEPEEQDEPVLSIRLTVDQSLEPVWRTYTERTEDGPAILSREREALGVVRVGHYVDRHLSWGKGSALSQYTDDADNLNPIFADVRRQSADAFKAQTGELVKLNDASSRLQARAADYGVRVRQQLLPGLDAASLSASGSSVGLFDGNIPARQMGLGSRRLLTVTMQLGKEGQRSLLLLDEIESALEPIRIRSLVRKLIEANVQVFATTHSPVAVSEAHGQSFWHVAWSGTATVVNPLDSSLAVLVQKCPYAILGDRSIVCEGKTELGFLRVAARQWEEARGTSIESLGICEVYAEGRVDCGKIAKGFLKLGSTVAVFADTDQNVGLDAATLANPAICDARVEGGIDAEAALIRSLPESAYSNLLLAIRPFRTGIWEELNSVFEMTRGSLKLGATRDGRSTTDVLAALASDKSWLKDTTRAESALSVLWDQLVPEGPLTKSLLKLERWCYGDDGR